MPLFSLLADAATPEFMGLNQSFLKTLALKTNVPKGINEAKNPANVLTKFNSPFAVCENNKTKKVKKSIPCIGPIILTASGMPA